MRILPLLTLQNTREYMFICTSHMLATHMHLLSTEGYMRIKEYVYGCVVPLGIGIYTENRRRYCVNEVPVLSTAYPCIPANVAACMLAVNEFSRLRLFLCHCSLHHCHSTVVHESRLSLHLPDCLRTLSCLIPPTI